MCTGSSGAHKVAQGRDCPRWRGARLPSPRHARAPLSQAIRPPHPHRLSSRLALHLSVTAHDERMRRAPVPAGQAFMACTEQARASDLCVERPGARLATGQHSIPCSDHCECPCQARCVRVQHSIFSGSRSSSAPPLWLARPGRGAGRAANLLPCYPHSGRRPRPSRRSGATKGSSWRPRHPAPPPARSPLINPALVAPRFFLLSASISRALSAFLHCSPPQPFAMVKLKHEDRPTPKAVYNWRVYLASSVAGTLLFFPPALPPYLH